MYNSGNSSKNVTGLSIVDGSVGTVDLADDAVTVDKLANAVNTVIDGAVQEAVTTTAAMSFVVDEDDMASDLATKVPTQQSVKAYIASEISGALVSEMTYKGGYDAATNTPLLDATPIAVAIGDIYTVTVAGTFFTIPVEVGDLLIAETLNASLEADWTIVNKNLDDAGIKTAYERNANTNEYNDAEKAKVGFVSVTQAVDLDTIETDTITNNSKVTNVTTNLSTTTTATTNTVVSSDGTNAVLPAATTTVAGMQTGADKTKLDGIEELADVTDATNVATAGALMDSEVTNLTQVKAFDTTDYATSTQGTTADNALPLAGGTMTGNITLGTNTIDGLAINVSATSNLGLGTGAVDSITTGDYNVGVGDGALTACTTGYYNTALGSQSLQANTTGTANVATGLQALYSNTTGIRNTATGYVALNLNTTGNYNTATGGWSLYSNTTGINNTALGWQAGDNITTGSSNIIIGSGVDAPSATASNQLNIGNALRGNTSNLTIGNAQYRSNSTNIAASGRTVTISDVQTLSPGSHWDSFGIEITINGIDGGMGNSQHKKWRHHCVGLNAWGLGVATEIWGGTPLTCTTVSSNTTDLVFTVVGSPAHSVIKVEVYSQYMNANCSISFS